jgi:hypothetical protein
MKITDFRPWHPEDKEMTKMFKKATRIYLESLTLLGILALIVATLAIL